MNSREAVQGQSGARWFRWVVPAIVFQSLIIGGGYGTGRELVEFFLRHGPLPGLAALAVAAFSLSLMCALSFEFARSFGAFDYQQFFERLLGRWWWTFEIGYLLLLLIILAVVSAAAGTMLNETFALPEWIGRVTVVVAVGVLVFGGSPTIEKFMTVWSFVLYGVYGVLVVWSLVKFGETSPPVLTWMAGPAKGWFVDGLKYAGYSLAAIPAALFSVRHVQSRTEALAAGMLAGPVAMIPAALFCLAMATQYPAIVDRPIPANYLLQALGSRGFQLVYQIMLLGALVRTGTGMIHAVNERVDAVYRRRGRTLSGPVRSALAIGFLAIAVVASQVGIVALVAKGYGTLTWWFLAVFAAPLLTVGLWKLRSAALAT